MPRNLFLAALFGLPIAAAPESAGAQGLLEFTQSGCGPCAQMRPAVARLKAAGVRVTEHDANEPTGVTLGIKLTPTFIAVDAAGHEVGRLVGAQPEDKLRALARKAGALK